MIAWLTRDRVHRARDLPRRDRPVGGRARRVAVARRRRDHVRPPAARGRDRQRAAARRRTSSPTTPTRSSQRAVAAGATVQRDDRRPGLRRPRRQRRGSRGQPLVLRELPALVRPAALARGYLRHLARVAVRAVRGATQLEDGRPRAHARAGRRDGARRRWSANGLEVDDFISVIFTATSDLVSEFPAYAARRLGFGDVPLLCARELEIERLDAAGGADAGPRRDRPAARRHHPRLPARRRRRCAAT